MIFVFENSSNMYQTKELYGEYNVEMGQVRVSASPSILTCYGLGSCVAVFLYDRISRIGGGAHITLPCYNEHDTVDSKLHYADYALETVMYRMQALGASILHLRAKIVGGANISAFSSICVGSKNTEAILHILTKEGIFLAASDIGGNSGRKARFNTCTGLVEITHELKTYNL
jgi:chemotaxis protein CheD